MGVAHSIPPFLIAVLAIWRVTHLLWGEDGPWDAFVRLRRAAGDSFFGRVLDCFHCLSLWVAAPVAFWMGSGWLERALLWVGLSGGAILLERATARSAPTLAPAIWSEQSLDEKEER